MQTQNRQDFVRKKLSTQKIAKDKFKPIFCGKDFYQAYQNDFMIIEKYVQNLSIKNSLIIWTIALCCLRRKGDWFAGFKKNARCSDNTIYIEHIDFDIFSLFKDLNISWPQKLNTSITFENFISHIQIKSIPEAALSGLFHFFKNDYDLVVLDYEPQPIEVLQLQIQNKRVLTFEKNSRLWPDTKYGERDVLSFLLHDLIHAEHFFSDPQKRDGQLCFYFFIEKVLAQNILNPLLLNSEFSKKFSYLISDMNSHVLHLLMTLKAIIDEAMPNDITSADLWLKICQTNVASSDLIIALSRMNSALFSPTDKAIVLDYFQNKAHWTQLK
jgi:hypothetical protein